MFKAFSWNVRGFNNSQNRNQVINLLQEGNFCLCGLLETKVKKRNLVRICSTVLGPWQWVSNNASCSNSMGIIFVWDPNSIRVMVISQSLQLMNLFIESVDGLHRFYCSFVYAHVRASGRKVLWKELMCHSLVVKDEPWLLMGDFNVILDPSKRSGGSSYFTSSMEDFRDCFGEIGVEDVGMSGLKFTWNKSLGRTDGLLKKLDRVMCNGAFVEKFVNSYALFLPFVASDHALAVIEIPVILRAKPRPFKFANFLADKGEFLPIVKKLKFAQGDLAKKVLDYRHELERVQAMMVDGSFNPVLREKETECLRAYKDAMRDAVSMLKQRAKHVRSQFVKHFHFQSVLGEAKLIDPISDPCSLFVKRLSLEDVEFMVRPVSKDEIKSVFFAMNDEKAPGPDGFLSNFFKDAWSVIRDEVCTAISDFFKNGWLLKEVNATIIALVPKSKSPQKVSDFRPISCCNVIYKAITKVIANRIKGYLGMLVDECHNAFIPMRQISNNVLLSQELVRNYHRNCGPSKVAFKIDIHKAYDSVEWSFMKQCLVYFCFHNDIITWIMSCLSSPMFSVNVNGYSHGFFKGMRGLRQGDPLSPYLFTLVMEVFLLMVKRKIEDDGNFKFHWRCDKLKITHLSFTDDLTVFSSADLHSVKILSNDLSEFSGVSGLVPNLDKSYV
ncbi:putative RNA-directed DNA polymerase, eukaryota, reverse transcriptase zinc-binding domain protein [Tanacetum coccineum]